MSEELELADIKKKKKKRFRIKKSSKTGTKANKSKEEFVPRSMSLIDDFDKHQQELLEKIPSIMESEAQHVKEYGQMFETLSRMVRIAENKYLDSKQSKDMYAALKGYAEMREIIADMKAMADFSQYSDNIKNDITDPLTQSCAAALIEFHKSVNSLLQQTIDDPGTVRLMQDKLKSYTGEAARKIKEAQTSSNKAADSMFSSKV